MFVITKEKLAEKELYKFTSLVVENMKTSTPCPSLINRRKEAHVYTLIAQKA